LLDEAAELLGDDGAEARAREAAALREEVLYAQGVLDVLDLEEDLDPELLGLLVDVQEEAVRAVAEAPKLTPLEEAQREDALNDWLDGQQVPNGWELAPIFVAVGATPEFLGKKIEAREIKLVSLGVLVTPLAVLLGTFLALATKYGKPSIFASGPQGFSESLYAYMSQANNNGSAFAGLSGDTPFYNLTGSLAMLAGRFLPILAVLAVAGSLAAKERVPAGPGTFPTHTPLFVGLLVGVVVIVGALTFFPVLALGPIVEHLLQGTGRLF
jgi:hypothetical protein